MLYNQYNINHTNKSHWQLELYQAFLLIISVHVAYANTDS